MKIALSPVKSSNIAEVGYDTSTNTLAVKFTNGGVYHYADVPAAVYTGLITAESVGKFFLSYVRNTYKATKQPADKGEDTE